MHRLQSILALAMSLTASLGFASQAHALTTRAPTVDVERRITIGMVNLTGDLLASRVPVICWEDPNGTNDQYAVLGSITGLTDDYYLDGSSGNDGFYPIETNGTTPSGWCATGGGAFTGTWNRLAYNGHYADFRGLAGSDNMRDGGGTNDTVLYGGNDSDHVYQYSTHTSATANGDAGDDFVAGRTAGLDDDLFGGTGNDCLIDDTNTAQNFNCGGQAGDQKDLSNSLTSVGCTLHQYCWVD
jgi:hypothetical protein